MYKRQLLEHLAGSADWTLTYLDHTSFIFLRAPAKAWQLSLIHISVGGKTISKLSFLPLETVVNGQTRSFNPVTGDIVCGATFSDK